MGAVNGGTPAHEDAMPVNREREAFQYATRLCERLPPGMHSCRELAKHLPRRRLVESEPLTYFPNMTATPQLDMTTLPPFGSAEEGCLMMALKFFELGRSSLGQAAEVAGYSKRAFIDVLGQYGIPVADYPASELANEVAW